jgi:hypothetical protein
LVISLRCVAQLKLSFILGRETASARSACTERGLSSVLAKVLHRT